jgi:hypothetical protein
VSSKDRIAPLSLPDFVAVHVRRKITNRLTLRLRVSATT